MLTLIGTTKKQHSTYLLEKRENIKRRKGNSLLSRLSYYFAL
ncbi:MAG: hypothetical protein HHAS10_00370 [Candidatus Altimarinota bacterium]